MIYCLKCNIIPEYEIREEEETYKVKGIPITTINQVTYCKGCGEQIEEININRAYDAYKKLTGKSVKED